VRGYAYLPLRVGRLSLDRSLDLSRGLSLDLDRSRDLSRGWSRDRLLDFGRRGDRDRDLDRDRDRDFLRVALLLHREPVYLL